MSRIADAMSRAKSPLGQVSTEVDASDPWKFDRSEVPLATQGPVVPQPPPATLVPRNTIHDIALHPAYANHLVLTPSVPPMVLEEYRRVAASLHKTQVDSGLRTLLITSALPGEGKTSVSTNLALVLSESYGRRVLLIDGDFRRPSLHRVFGLSDSTDLVTRWSDGASTAAPPPIRVSKTLSILCSRQPEDKSFQAVAGGLVEGVLREAVNHYDWIIVDGPPVNVLSEAKLLAMLVNGILLVVQAQRTPADAVLRAVEELGRTKLLGTIMNRVDAAEVGDPTDYQAYPR